MVVDVKNPWRPDLFPVFPELEGHEARTEAGRKIAELPRVSVLDYKRAR
jgi:hypothetical protein